MTWIEVSKYIKKLNMLEEGRKYRLPIEAKWEYSCRAGTSSAFHYGDKITTAMVNFNEGKTTLDLSKNLYTGKTCPVGI